MGEFVPWYGLYALLFADHGLGAARISSLLVIWSVTGFMCEVPSGAWADKVSRRGLLILSSLLHAAGFAAWTVFPSYGGFAVGFDLWGVGGALASGTFEALLYDELAGGGSAGDYAVVIGYATSASEAATLLATLSAAPLFAWGGYGLVGWVSVGVALTDALLAASLPSAPRAATVASSDDQPPMSYLATLRAGISEVTRVRTVRRGMLLASVIFGFTAFDEYFGLLAGDRGVSTASVPILVSLTVVGSLVGAALAGRTARMRRRTMASALAVAGVAFAVGVLLVGPGLSGVLGFAVIGVGYGIIANSVIVTETRLQDAIEGPARATVTSVSSLFAEGVSLLIFGFVALGSQWWSMSTSLALLGVPVVAAAFAVPRWLPRAD